MIYMGDDMQIGQNEVCTDTKPPLGIELGHDAANHGHGHAHLTQTSQVHSHQHPHNSVVANTMSVYGDGMIDTFKAESLCQVQCMDCQKYFNSEELLIAHRLIRHSGNANSNGNGNGNGNNRSGGSEKTYECDVCGKTFNKHSSWWKHKKCHTGERAYKCYICEKAFTQQANLHRHMFVHSGEKPHACKICDKRFSQAANLLKHQVIHTNEKPYGCKMCPKHFTQRANLKKHEMVHTGERPYACPICKKAYAQYANMKKHMLVHAKSKQSVAYLCAKCKVLFDTITVYDEHLENCKNSSENYDFDEVLEKLTQSAQAKEVMMPINGSNGGNIGGQTSGGTDQQTASIIVVTAAITPQPISKMHYTTSRVTHNSTIVSNAMAGPSSAIESHPTTTVTGLATIMMPSTNLKLIKYPRIGHQQI